MGRRPTHRDESAFLRVIDSKRVTRDFRRSEIALVTSVITAAAELLEGTPKKQKSPNEDSGQNEDYAQRDNHRLR